MKLSEAIRLGSMLGPQAYRTLSQRRRKYILFGPVVNEFCAMGAAQAAVGARSSTRIANGGEVLTPFRGKSVVRKAGEKYTVIEGEAFDFDPSWQYVLCPACQGVSGEVFRIVPHLNDDHRWTREQISDWVERIERERCGAPEAATTVAAVDPVGEKVTG